MTIGHFILQQIIFLIFYGTSYLFEHYFISIIKCLDSWEARMSQLLFLNEYKCVLYLLWEEYKVSVEII